MNTTKVKRDVNDRVGIIGGSSIGAILGLSTYKSEYEAWEDFTGTEKPPVDEETQERFDMGHELEGFIAKQTERVYGVKLKVSNFAFVHPSYSWLICHPDRIMVGKLNGKTIGVEIKSSSAFDSNRWGDADTSQVPMDYLCQCHSYMMCGVCDEVWLIRFSNNRLTRYIVEKDKEMEDMILGRLVNWVNKVNNGYVPVMTNLEQIKKAYNRPTEGIKEATAEIADIVAELKDSNLQKKVLESKIDELKAKITLFMGEDAKRELVYDGKKIGSWFQTTKTSVDSKKLQEEQPDIYDKYLKTYSFMQFRASTK